MTTTTRTPAIPARSQIQGMLIVPIVAKTINEARDQIAQASGDAVELRLDAMDAVVESEIKELAALKKTVTTDRRKYEGGFKAQTDTQRFEDIHTAIFCKPWAVDIELGSPKLFRRKLIKAAREQGVKVISSYHNFQRTPPAEKLEEMVRDALPDSDYVKIVCTPQSQDDVTALLDLVRHHPGKVAAFGLGEKNAHTRVLSLKLGAPFGFAKGAAATGPGQLTVQEMKEQLTQNTTKHSDAKNPETEANTPKTRSSNAKKVNHA